MRPSKPLHLVDGVGTGNGSQPPATTPPVRPVVTLNDLALTCGCLVGLLVGFVAVVIALVWLVRWVR